MIEPYADRFPVLRFRDRAQAATFLAGRLSRYQGRHPLVVGIPRGGVLMASVIADRLGGDLDVVLVRKLRAPGRPELAIGSVSERGEVFLSKGFENGVSDDYVRGEVQSALELLRYRRDYYTPHRSSVDPRGRHVIVVDDGVATGATMIAALRAVGHAGAAWRIATMGAASTAAIEDLKAEADEIVCGASSPYFLAVSLFFEDFRQLTDEEVIDALHHHGTVRP